MSPSSLSRGLEEASRGQRAGAGATGQASFSGLSPRASPLPGLATLHQAAHPSPTSRLRLPPTPVTTPCTEAWAGTTGAQSLWHCHAAPVRDRGVGVGAGSSEEPGDAGHPQKEPQEEFKNQLHGK